MAMFRRHKPQSNRWKGFVLGSLGGVAGIFAMQYYWQLATALNGGQDPRKAQANDTPQPLDSLSLVGQQHEAGESSTAAIGRIAYRVVTGKEPVSQETRTMLSYLVHWIISMAVAGMYGAVRGRASMPDVEGGPAMGTSLWLFGDEVAMPLLGLTDGPTAYSPLVHVHAFGAHLAYGVASPLATQALRRLF
jgi:hypothetical protein